MGVQRIDRGTVQSTAGVVRLIRRAAEVAAAWSEAEGPGSPRRLLALGIDLAADQAWRLLSTAINIEGPVPVVADPVLLLPSAEQLLSRVYIAAASTRLHNLRARFVALAWEADTGVGTCPAHGRRAAGHSDAWSRLVVSATRLWVVPATSHADHTVGSGRIPDQAVRPPGRCQLCDFALWTRVGVMRGRSISSGIGQSTIGPEQPSPAATGASTWATLRKSPLSGAVALWRGGDIKVNGMAT